MQPQMNLIGPEILSDFRPLMWFLMACSLRKPITSWKSECIHLNMQRQTFSSSPSMYVCIYFTLSLLFNLIVFAGVCQVLVGGRVWTCTVIFLPCSHGPYASRRRGIMIMKHTDVGVWFCRWNIKHCRAWGALTIWWLPLDFWMITHVTAGRCVEFSLMFPFFFFSLWSVLIKADQRNAFPYFWRSKWS